MAEDSTAQGEQLLRTFGAITKGLRQWVRAHMGADPAITVGRAGVLLALLERDQPVSMSALGSARDLTPREMTVLASGLVREGLVGRSTDPQDRRVSLLSLTPAGRAIAAEQLLPAGRQAAALFNELSDPDREELLRLLHEVATALQRHGINVALPPAS
ncbi:MAG TPA: MarR family winged helix-turn-helix transcriptional regulator [Solirubrobacteraceae bacterium]|nr:MarR family winged helix-turn-helix transcriptional regulator [Solirubrobacteraceae bacterium]